MRRSSPEESAGTKQPRDFLQEQSRLGQMFQQFRRSDYVVLLRGQLRIAKFALENFKTQLAYVLDCARRHVQSLAIPAILSRGLKQVARTAADIEQSIRLTIW